MRSGAFLLSTLSSVLLTSMALGEEPSGEPVYDESSPQYVPPTIERRGGFAMAITSGYGVGNYRGYPLEVAALNDPSARQSTGTSLASNLSLWLGGSPRDWITAGVGISLMSASLNQTVGQTAGFLFHLEGFPLYSLGGTFVDLGIGFDGGIGVSSLFDEGDKNFEDPLAESGALSILAFNVFWEPIRFWHISMGPSLSYTHAFSQTMNVDQITLGFRSALYGVMPKNSKK